MKMVLEQQKQHSSSPLACPMPKGEYFYKDIELTGFLIPKLFSNTKFMSSFDTKVKIQKNNTWLNAYSLSIFGEYTRE